VQDEERLSVANTDWLRKYKGTSRLLLLPKDTNEVLSKFACISQFFTVSTNILHVQHFLSLKLPCTAGIMGTYFFRYLKSFLIIIQDNWLLSRKVVTQVCGW
jgi:hypothetical protein